MDFFYVKSLHDSGKKHSIFASDNNNSLSGLDVKLILEINNSPVCAIELEEYPGFFLSFYIRYVESTRGNYGLTRIKIT